MIVGFLAPFLIAAGAGSAPYFPTPFITWFECKPGAEPVPLTFARDDEMYSEYLRAAREPSLYLASKKPPPRHETLRFNWLRSFDAPIFIRVELGDRTSRLIAKRLSEEGDHREWDERSKRWNLKRAKISRNTDRMLTSGEVRELRALLSRTNIFNLLPGQCAPPGTDGAGWLIEGVNEKGYHFISRQSPRTGEVREMGEFLIRLTGWKEDIY